MAAPVAVTLATGADKEAAVSELYGGRASESAALADPVYRAIGQACSSVC